MCSGEMEHIAYNVLEDMPELYEKLTPENRLKLCKVVGEYLENDKLDEVMREALEDHAYDFLPDED